MKKILITMFIILTVGVLLFLIYNYSKDKNNENFAVLNNNEIVNYYNKYVKTNKKANIYKYSDNKYEKYGTYEKNVNILLENGELNNKTKYFKIANSNFYINYNDVIETNEFILSERYKNYIPFNINIKTKNPVSFYNSYGVLLYTIYDTLDFSVLVKSDEKYGVIYNNELVYIKKENIDSEYYNDNSTSNKDKIRTLTYHFVYNPETTYCNQSICQSFEQFESHLKYIRENNYFTLKLNELEMYLNGEINIPDKSIVLTIDDGTIFDIDAIKLLEQYQVNVTMFVITNISDNFDYLKSDYLDLESHTNNMHNQYECPGYGMQGGGILCLDEDKVLEDLKISQDKLGGSTYFAYPFFDFNDRAISLLKKAGFKLAFIGQYNTDGYSYPNKTDKYKVPRKTIFSTTKVEEFIGYLE